MRIDGALLRERPFSLARTVAARGASMLPIGDLGAADSVSMITDTLVQS
jgi:hypothetical protein